MKLLLILAIFALVLIESSVIPVPFVFSILLIYGIVKRDDYLFALSFGFGILLDILTVRTLGSTSIFLILFFEVVLLYQKKYEIDSYPFVIFSGFLGSFLYTLLFQKFNLLPNAFLGCIVSVLLFYIGKRLYK